MISEKDYMYLKDMNMYFRKINYPTPAHTQVAHGKFSWYVAVAHTRGPGAFYNPQQLP